MIVHKFGGASIKDGFSVKSMAEICREHIKTGVVVVSAMGKCTNLLEKVTKNYVNGEETAHLAKQFIKFHTNLCKELFDPNAPVFSFINDYSKQLRAKLDANPGLNYDFEYDQIVSFGELFSTKIIAEYLSLAGVDVQWVDIRDILKTDSTFREGKVNWGVSEKLVQQTIGRLKSKLVLTQGFIGADLNNITTTLGREGSDYTAAVLGTILNANQVVVWKDVPGVFCADPKWLPDATRLGSISYYEAIELAFFGAKVIHPKTIKPLQNKNIPLQVKSFINVHQKGTIIGDFDKQDLPPFYIRKEQQILISVMPKDFSFIMEENISHIFGIFARHQIKVNLMQNSALSFSVVVDGEMRRVMQSIDELKERYSIRYNENLELITIRHYFAGAEQKVLKGKKLMVEQKSRTVARYVVQSS